MAAFAGSMSTDPQQQSEQSTRMNPANTYAAKPPQKLDLAFMARMISHATATRQIKYVSDRISDEIAAPSCGLRETGDARERLATPTCLATP